MKNRLLCLKVISIMFLFWSCVGHGPDGSAYNESIEKYSFRLMDDSARFQYINYPELGVVDKKGGNKAEWVLDLYTPKVQVIMQTNMGTDTLIYEISKKKINQEEDYFGEDVLVIRMDRPKVVFHTFDTLYFNEIFDGPGNYEYMDVELVLKQ